MVMKKCSKCKQVKEVCFFSKNNTTKDKLHCSCKECDKKKYFENRERNIVYMRNYKKNNSEKLKLYRDKKNEILSIKKKEYYEKNKDIILESAKKKTFKIKKNVKIIISNIEKIIWIQKKEDGKNTMRRIKKN